MPASPSTIRRIKTSEEFGGIELDVIDAGQPNNPVIVLAHGFPESSHSWRHQIDPLVNAGYRVLVPDQRGYGSSSAPREVSAYRSDHLAADLIALLDDVGADTATFVGHDWGSFIVSDLARFHPGRVAGAINVSVPYNPWPMQPTELFKALFGDRFFYITYFQQPDVPERELEANITHTLRSTLWGASAEMFGPMRDPSEWPSMDDGKFLGTFAEHRVLPDGLPAWMPQADFDRYVEQFETSKFFGPLSWYRNLDANWELTRDLATPEVPWAFIGGDKDLVIAHNMGPVDAMPYMLPNFRGTEIIENAGHWTQQEKPEAFSHALLTLLERLQTNT